MPKRKSIVFTPEFTPPILSVAEQVFMALKKGPLSYRGIQEDIGRVRGGGGITDACRDMIKDGYIRKRKCNDCGMHDMYEIIRKS